MPPSDPERLVRLNDTALTRWILASGEEIEAELERIVVGAQPLIADVIARYTRLGSAFPRADAEDVRNTVNVRLVAKLRALARFEDDAVIDFRKYVATITYNAINDHYRKAFPARARLKSRLRYVLMHDARLALWEAKGVAIGGRREWLGAADAIGELASMRAGVAASGDRPADALVEIFAHTSRPVRLDTLIAFLAEAWNVVDVAPTKPPAHVAAHEPAALDLRKSLMALWNEIRELRPMQRKALLLNLRGGDASNVVSLIVLTGTARFEEVAAALEMTVEELTALWNDLPLDDLSIASRLGVTRQQVINLRKSARERLTRRMQSTIGGFLTY
ncbi:MAG TPA: hypothetical protein VEK11_23815 [Thermoanaerobaculia bacterium]|nr:hypothetical protein [Thermoanaerobaculia bacterium]